MIPRANTIKAEATGLSAVIVCDFDGNLTRDYEFSIKIMKRFGSLVLSRI